MPPARRIPRNYRHLTGVTAPLGGNDAAEYESPLEHDHHVRLLMDPTVRTYHVQPLRLTYDHGGRRRFYTPDVLVHYHPRLDGTSRPSELQEVKSTRDLRDKREKLEPAFLAARAYAEEHGLIYRVLTEADIRTPELDSCRFLHVRRDHPVPEVLQRALITTTAQVGPQPINTILTILGLDGDAYWAALNATYALLARHHLHADLSRPIHRQAVIWTPVHGKLS